MSVCNHTYQNFTIFSVPVAFAWHSSGGIAICYVLTGFVNDVMFARERPGRCSTSRVLASTDLPWAEPNFDIYSCFVICEVQ